MSKEKEWKPNLWKPIGIKPVEIKDYSGAYNGQLHSFLDYQKPNDRYEVRGIMPKAPEYEKVSSGNKQLLKKL